MFILTTFMSLLALSRIQAPYSYSTPLRTTVGKLYTSSRSCFAHSASFVHPWNGFFSAERREEVALWMECVEEVRLVTLLSEDERIVLGLGEEAMV